LNPAGVTNRIKKRSDDNIYLSSLSF